MNYERHHAKHTNEADPGRALIEATDGAGSSTQALMKRPSKSSKTLMKRPSKSSKTTMKRPSKSSKTTMKRPATSATTLMKRPATGAIVDPTETPATVPVTSANRSRAMFQRHHDARRTPCPMTPTSLDQVHARDSLDPYPPWDYLDVNEVWRGTIPRTPER